MVLKGQNKSFVLSFYILRVTLYHDDDKSARESTMAKKLALYRFPLYEKVLTRI